MGNQVDSFGISMSFFRRLYLTALIFIINRSLCYMIFVFYIKSIICSSSGITFLARYIPLGDDAVTALGAVLSVRGRQGVTGGVVEFLCLDIQHIGQPVGGRRRAVLRFFFYGRRGFILWRCSWRC